MSRERGDTGRYTETVTLDDVLSVFEAVGVVSLGRLTANQPQPFGVVDANHSSSYLSGSGSPVGMRLSKMHFR